MKTKLFTLLIAGVLQTPAVHAAETRECQHMQAEIKRLETEASAASSAGQETGEDPRAKQISQRMEQLQSEAEQDVKSMEKSVGERSMDDPEVVKAMGAFEKRAAVRDAELAKLGKESEAILQAWGRKADDPEQMKASAAARQRSRQQAESLAQQGRQASEAHQKKCRPEQWQRAQQEKATVAAGESPMAMMMAIPDTTQMPEEGDAAWNLCNGRREKIDQRYTPAHLLANQRNHERGERKPLKGETAAQTQARFKRLGEQDQAIYKMPAVQALAKDPRFYCTGEGSSGAPFTARDSYIKAFEAIRKASHDEARPCQKKVDAMKDGDGKTRAINQCNDQLQAKYKPQVRAVIQQAGPKLAAAYTQHYQDRAACLQYREAALRELPTAARGGQFELRAVAQNWEIARNMNLTLGMVCTSNSDQFANTIGAVFAPGGG